MRKFLINLNEKVLHYVLLIMVDENMLPRERLFKRTFSVLTEIRHQNLNSPKLIDTNSIRPA